MKVRHSPTPSGEKRTDKDLAKQWKTIDWEKTVITHINEGFDFLGYNFRK